MVVALLPSMECKCVFLKVEGGGGGDGDGGGLNLNELVYWGSEPKYPF